MRSIACFFPVSSHLIWELTSGFLKSQWHVQGLWLELLTFVFGNGPFGVRLFMVLSGFLITYLMVLELKSTGRFSLRDFYVRRTLRIWPGYFVVVIYVFWVFPYLRGLLGLPVQIQERLWPFLVFLSNFENIRLQTQPGLHSDPQLSLLWSVSIEEQFYLIWALVFAMVGALGIFRWGLFCWFAALATQFAFVGDEVRLGTHTVPCFLYLASGAILGYFYARRPEMLESRLGALGYRKSVLITILLLCATFGVNLLQFITPLWCPIYGLMTAAFASWLLITQVVYREHRFSLGKIKPLVWFARYTYAMYLYNRIAQFLMLMLYVRLGLKLQSLPALLTFSALSVGLCFLLSVLSFYTVESYFLRKKSRFTHA